MSLHKSRHIAALIFIFLLSSCSNMQQGNSISKTFRHIYDELSPQAEEINEADEEVVALDIFEEKPEIEVEIEKEIEILTIPEPEETVAEEVKDLESLGKWEEGEAQDPFEEEILYDFPVTINRQVEYYLDFFQNKQKNGFARWLARSGRYKKMITQKLDEAGLPLDLLYLPMIESGFSDTAYSRSKAVGLWQFMRGTAIDYGLKVTSYIDERKDPYLSTQAAIKYLSSLHKRFDSWHLAVAAYNAGEGTINKGLKKYKTNNFWELAQQKYLRLETKRYVPKLIAAIMIAKDPAKYGFTDLQYQEPPSFEVVKVPGWTSLRAVAVSCGSDLEDLRSLNRQLSKGITPPELNFYELRVPSGKAELVSENLPRVHTSVTTTFKTHTIRKNDTLNKICKTYNISKKTLLKANNLRKAKLTPGKMLRIPFQVSKYTLLSKEEFARQKNQTNGENGSILHTIKQGETVSEIANKYSVSSKDIARWNKLQSVNRIRAGQQLIIFTEKNISLASSSKKREKIASAESGKNDVKVIIAAKKKTLPEAKPKIKDTYYMVRGGDSLWTIARKFKLSTLDIKKWNNLNGNMIHPGLKLLLKINI